MNPLYPTTNIGALGELLVQMRLLQFGIQAAPPLKDSGNDLIGICGECFKAIQVKTTTNGIYAPPAEDTLYHILAIVELTGDAPEYNLEHSSVYLIPKYEVASAPRRTRDLASYTINRNLTETLWSMPEAGT